MRDCTDGPVSPDAAEFRRQARLRPTALSPVARKGCSRRSWISLSTSSTRRVDFSYLPETVTGSTRLHLIPSHLQLIVYLPPLTLLHLSQASKHFRSLLLPTSRRGYLWAAARQNAGLPAPPPGVGELRYIALVFQNNCFVSARLLSTTGDYVLTLWRAGVWDYTGEQLRLCAGRAVLLSMFEYPVE